jgi:CMP/dCMP kinase
VSGAAEHIVVAIDGPGASGKSSTARGLAARLGFLLVDTGAMYRTLAWHCLRQRVSIDDPKAIAAECRRWKTKLHCADGQVRLLVAGVDPGAAIRTPEVSAAASKVSAVPTVRRWMKKVQRECQQFGNLVMEGRDIGTNVFPETDYKFFLDAPPEERARRRAAQGHVEDLVTRDHQDSQRAAAPLMIPLGATLVNNAALTVEETVELIAEQVKGRMAKEGPIHKAYGGEGEGNRKV